MAKPSHTEIAENSVQDALVARLSQADLGWKFVAANELPRQTDDVLIESWVSDALARLNPSIGARPSRADEVLARLRAVTLSEPNDGLLAANEEMVAWLCGRRTMRLEGRDDYEPIRLIDFNDPHANRLTVSTEVTFDAVHKPRRYDLVLWVNGFPLVVGETKTPDSLYYSWLDGANDINRAYEIKTAAFFVPNVLSFATEGKELHYGALGQAPETWLPWLSSQDAPLASGLPSVLRSAELLLAPGRILDILRTFTFFARRQAVRGDQVTKVIPRYPQVEAVDAIVTRVLDQARDRGLIWHHQGSGKTLIIAFASARLRQMDLLDAPTILVVLDRLELIDQVRAEFAAVGLPGVQVAETRDDLRQLLRDDARGIIITTIFRFSDPSVINVRKNIVVMVDEAHRTQEGRLGLDMRAALPHAQFIGLTGSPISSSDHNTWTLFGDPGDPDGVLSYYSVERSIADGATVPIHIETRLEDFSFDADTLNEAFDELVSAEGLDGDERVTLGKRVMQVDQWLKNPARVEAICRDILEHYRTKMAPLGLKAQIVAYDRELCVLYYDTLSKLLADGEEATVVMTGAKDDPGEWSQWDRDREAENRVKARFLDFEDPLKFLIVTAKLLTGFDAPIEGVMYLDKPLRAHTLFQAVCRTNRRWVNPITNQEKLYGLIVNYVGMGLGAELAKAVAVRNVDAQSSKPSDLDGLIAAFSAQIAQTLLRFEGIDRQSSGFEQLYAAHERLAAQVDRDAFAQEFLRLQGLFEFLWPDTALRPFEVDYRWLAKIYRSAAPQDLSGRLLWQRLGAKTAELVYEHVGEVTIEGIGLESVAIDAGVFETLRQLNLFPDPGPGGQPAPPTVEDVLDTMEKRLQAKLHGSHPHPVWVSLSEQLEALRKGRIDSAIASVEFLKRLLELARELVGAEKATEDGDLDEIKVVDPHRGALTQILKEYAPQGTPAVIEVVVEEIDAIVRPVRGTGWQSSHPGDREVRRQLREVLRRHALPPIGELFDRAYAYIREHY